MSETFECGDTGALVAYLYDECEPEIRQAIAGHLTRCVSCSSEIDGLGWTRQRLAAWTPPVPALGFQMPAAAEPSPLPWWRAPLPAWAQTAAALLIFGAGLSIGLARGSAGVEGTASSGPVAPAAVDTVSAADLTALEQRLKSEMAQVRVASAPVRQTAAPGDEIMEQVEALLAQSEERQRREFTLRSVELARDFEAQRRVDLASVRETVGQFQGVAGTEIRQQREAIDRINSIMRVSQQAR